MKITVIIENFDQFGGQTDVFILNTFHFITYCTVILFHFIRYQLRSYCSFIL